MRSGIASAAVPAHHHAVELDAGLLDERHEDDRTAGLEQRAFIDDLFRHCLLALRLTEHDEIEAAGEAAELIGGGGQAGAEDAVFVGNSSAAGALLETVGGGLGFSVSLGALRLDEFRRNAAHHGAGNDRLVGEGEAEHVRFACPGQRDGKVAGRIALAQP